jgi:hypothetical protein
MYTKSSVYPAVVVCFSGIKTVGEVLDVIVPGRVNNGVVVFNEATLLNVIAILF